MSAFIPKYRNNDVAGTPLKVLQVVILNFNKELEIKQLYFQFQ
jgi:hypothetical protein